ncbi:hypothetical protein PLESTF_001669000 [Pleodorina starrii]|nr:hypothetical protein PLESTF_001669000 [Pleodorina starrii]
MLRRSPRIANLTAVDYSSMGNGSPLSRRRRVSVRRYQASWPRPSALPVSMYAAAASHAEAPAVGDDNDIPRVYQADFMDGNEADINAESESDNGVNSMAGCKAEPAEVPGEDGPHEDGQGVPLAGGEGITLVKRASQPLSSLEFVALGLELSQRIPPWAVQGVLFQLWLPFLSICRDVFGTLLNESQLERLLVPVFEMAWWEAPMQIPGLSDAGFNIWASSHMHVVFFLAIAIEKVLANPSVQPVVAGALYDVLIHMSQVLGQEPPGEE